MEMDKDARNSAHDWHPKAFSAEEQIERDRILARIKREPVRVLIPPSRRRFGNLVKELVERRNASRPTREG